MRKKVKFYYTSGDAKKLPRATTYKVSFQHICSFRKTRDQKAHENMAQKNELLLHYSILRVTVKQNGELEKPVLSHSRISNPVLRGNEVECECGLLVIKGQSCVGCGTEAK